MKDKLIITFVSAADWFVPKVWIDFFTALKEKLSVSPRKYCLSESKWFPFVSIDTMATDITALNSCYEENKECFSWIIRFDGHSFANLDLWKRTARMYSMCTLSFTGNWVTKEHQRALLSILFERAVWSLSAFYGSTHRHDSHFRRNPRRRRFPSRPEIRGRTDSGHEFLRDSGCFSTD